MALAGNVAFDQQTCRTPATTTTALTLTYHQSDEVFGALESARAAADVADAVD